MCEAPSTASPDALATAGCRVAEVEWPEECDGLGTAWEAVIAAGAASALAPEYEQHRDRMGQPIRALIEQGLALTPAERSAAESLALHCRALVSERFADFDAFLTPATGDVAPERLDSTGDPLFNRSWTLLRLPASPSRQASTRRGCRSLHSWWGGTVRIRRCWRWRGLWSRWWGSGR